MRYSLFLLVFLYVLSSCNSRQKADRIYINARIWTGDSTNDRATAVATRDSLILYVGNDYSNFKGPKTEIIDLDGKMVVPGFTDNHTHFLAGGYQLASVNLRQAKTQAEFIKTLKDYISTHPKIHWIMGGDWDHEAWGGELPTRSWIDSITGDHPVFIERYDGHMSLANSLALKLAGIDRNTPNPPGGEIVRVPHSGEPTGVLRDDATALVKKFIPLPSQIELDQFLQRAEEEALEHGVTEVNDMSSLGGWAELATYRKARAANALRLRIYAFVPLRDWEKLDSFVKKEGWGDNMLYWGGLKGFVDGSLGSTTAWFYKPYLDAPGKTGLQVTDTNDLRRWIIKADSAGLHCTTHAIGDRANDFILSVYQEAEKRNPGKDHRFRVEHAQHLSKEALGKFASLGVIPSVQPYHLIDDGKWAYKRLDSDRLSRTYAFKTLLGTGARMTFGSDWTVAPLDPIAGIYAAVTRRTLDDKNPEGWFPSEKISVEDALRCYTVNNAYASFQERRLGQLKTGFLADFVVLSDDILDIAPEKIRDITVLRTIVNGKEVYKKK